MPLSIFRILTIFIEAILFSQPQLMSQMSEDFHRFEIGVAH